jgi:uncharacterized membrane protein
MGLMTTHAQGILLLGKGTPLTPGGTLAMGIIVGLVGLIGVVVTFLPRSKYGNLRMSRRVRTPMSRLSNFLFSMCFVVFGLLAIADGYFHAIHFSPRPYLFGALGLAFAGAAFDGFMSWKRRGFPVLARCPDCGRSIDFKLAGTKCACGRKIG